MARMMYELAAQQGYVSTIYNLGVMYDNDNSPGVEQSYERAFEYYEQPADLGHPLAQFNLGIMYYNGRGVQKDIAKSREWWTKAAAQGQKNAIKNLNFLDQTGNQ